MGLMGERARRRETGMERSSIILIFLLLIKRRAKQCQTPRRCQTRAVFVAEKSRLCGMFLLYFLI